MNGDLVVVDDLPGAFTAEVLSAFANRPGEEFDIALSGGETARACYERLASDGAQAIDWLVVNFFWGDERCVPPDHMDSNELLGRQALLEKVGAANAVYPRASTPTSSASARSASSTSSTWAWARTATRPASFPAHGPWTPTPANSSASTRTPAGATSTPA